MMKMPEGADHAPAKNQGAPAGGGGHHAHMAAEFRKRFWISLGLTLPILVLSPMLQGLVGLREAVRFSGDTYVLFGFASAVFWYGGWPFLKGFIGEVKSKTQDLANTAAMWLTIIALGSGAVTFFVWLVVVGKDFAFAIERTVTVMVIACPHALGLAVPLVVAVSTALAASHGLLIRNRVAFESARKVQAIIFDKTGTLTEGRFGVTDTLLLSSDVDEDTLRKYAASVDANSEHPIAKAIASASEKKLPVEGFKAIPGKGALGRVDGKDIKVVSPGYLREENIDLVDKRIEPLQAEGKTVVFVLVDGKLQGAIALADIVRPRRSRRSKRSRP